MNRVIGVTALAGCAAFLIAGCGTTHATPGASGPSDPVTTGSPAPKPTSERVPPAATVLTVAARPGLVTGAKSPAPVTITDPATVRRVVSVVDGLRVFPRGLMNCPADTGRAVQMTFRSGAGGPVLASVAAGMTGCQGVSLSVDGQPRTSLAGGGSLAREVLAITGLHWTGYSSGGGAAGAPTPGGVMSHG
jgi:hypothetical protein